MLFENDIVKFMKMALGLRLADYTIGLFYQRFIITACHVLFTYGIILSKNNTSITGDIFMAFKSNSDILYEQLVNKIENQITQGILKEGDRLPSENNLAKENGISRVTVRQALKLLNEMGLVKTRKGIGSFVLESNPETVKAKVEDFIQHFQDNFNQAMQVKIMIEPAIMAYVAQIASCEQVKKLENIWSEVSLTTSKKIYNELCIQFHLALIEIADNPLLSEFYCKLEEMEHMYLHELLLPSDSSKAMRSADLEQHGRIIKAIKEHKPDLAYLYCKEHLEFFFNFYTNLQKDTYDE